MVKYITELNIRIISLGSDYWEITLHGISHLTFLGSSLLHTVILKALKLHHQRQHKIKLSLVTTHCGCSPSSDGPIRTDGVVLQSGTLHGNTHLSHPVRQFQLLISSVLLMHQPDLTYLTKIFQHNSWPAHSGEILKLYHHTRSQLNMSMIFFNLDCNGIAGLVQERRNSNALAMELRLSCIKPSVCTLTTNVNHWYGFN